MVLALALATVLVFLLSFLGINAFVFSCIIQSFCEVSAYHLFLQAVEPPVMVDLILHFISFVLLEMK
jgi:hypothetical protein